MKNSVIKLIFFLEKIGKHLVFHTFLVFLFFYIFIVVIPNYYGCIVPENLCMSGNAKIENVLSITASFLPVLLVAYGYKVWRNQKAAEVLANKAQEMYFELDKILIVLTKHNDVIVNHPETITKESAIYKELMPEIDELVKKTKIFKDLLEAENSKHIQSISSLFFQLREFESNESWENVLNKTKMPTSMRSAIQIKNQFKEIEIIMKLKGDIQETKDSLIKIILHR